MRESTTQQMRHYHHRTIAALAMASGAGLLMFLGYLVGAF